MPTKEDVAEELSLPVAERSAHWYELLIHLIGHDAGYCTRSVPALPVAEQSHDLFDASIIAAATHIMLKIDPEVSARLDMAYEKILRTNTDTDTDTNEEGGE